MRLTSKALRPAPRARVPSLLMRENPAGAGDRTAFAAWVAPDRFGVPANILGQHPEDVYALAGRIVMLSALLEDRQRTLLQTLNDVADTEYAGEPVRRVIVRLGEAVSEAATLEMEWRGAERLLERSGEAFEFRNAVVHNLWPAQPDGTLFGHRQHPRTGYRQITVASIDEMTDAVRTLVDLIGENETWLARAPHVQALRRTQRG